MDGDLASIYGNIHNEIHSGWAEEGRGDCRVNRSRGESKICGRNIARIPVNRVEAAFVNFTYCRGIEGGGEEEEGGWGGGALHLAGRRIRVSASRLRWNKDANYCLARAPGNDPTPPTGTERRKPEGSLLFRVWNEVRRMYQACLRGRKMFEMENKILNTSHHFLKFICFELHVCILYLFLFFFVLRQV